MGTEAEVLAERPGLCVLAGDGAVRKTTRFHRINTKREDADEIAWLTKGLERCGLEFRWRTRL